MILIDANLLLYAYNPSAAQHERARQWLEQTFSAPQAIGLSWSTILAFLRIGTNPRAFPQPLSLAEATAAVDAWLTVPGVQVVRPGARHWEILRSLLEHSQSKGPLVTDAHLAALAIEHGATLASSDRDFTRFPSVDLVNPLRGG